MAGTVGTGDPLHLLGLGDSIVAGIGAATRDQSLPARLAAALADITGQAVHWRAHGESGRAVAGLLERVDGFAANQRADVILVSIGVNDVTGLTPARRWRQRVAALCGRLRSHWPGALIVFAGLPPMERFPLPPQPLRFCLGWRAHRLDRMLAAEVGGRPGMRHVPTRIDPRIHAFCDDGFHPSAEAYALWARDLAALLAARRTTTAPQSAAPG